MKNNNDKKILYVVIGFFFVTAVALMLMLGSGGTTPRSTGGGSNPYLTPAVKTSTSGATPSSTVTAQVYPTVTSPLVDRSNPEPVYEQVKVSLEANNMPSLYAEMGPGLREVFTLGSLIESETQVKADLGEIKSINLVEPLHIRTDGDFNSEWADATVIVHRENGDKTYLVRFYLENGEWWLFSTLEVSP